MVSSFMYESNFFMLSLCSHLKKLSIEDLFIYQNKFNHADEVLN